MEVENSIPNEFKKWAESEQLKVFIASKIDEDEKVELMKQINRIAYKAFKGGWIARNNEEVDEEFSDYNVGE